MARMNSRRLTRSFNPEGIVSSSPGLRVPELPWVTPSIVPLNLEEVAPTPLIYPEYDVSSNQWRNLFEVEGNGLPFSQGRSEQQVRCRVATASRTRQPWALLRNPFGISPQEKQKSRPAERDGL